EAPSSSRLRLCEDGRRLGPVHSEHAAIASAGHGRYSHWGDTLYFSTIDGSDPNINGRRYTVSIMPPAIKLLGFGSCHVSAALEDLQRRDLADNLWRDPGLSNSPRETLQLLKFHLGMLDVPKPLQEFTVSPPGSDTLATVY